jgi:hypothetical protein
VRRQTARFVVSASPRRWPVEALAPRAAAAAHLRARSPRHPRARASRAAAEFLDLLSLAHVAPVSMLDLTTALSLTLLALLALLACAAAQPATLASCGGSVHFTSMTCVRRCRLGGGVFHS